MVRLSTWRRWRSLKSLVGLLAFAAGPASAQIAVRGETVYTMAGAPIKDGVVLVRDGKIERVGTAAEVPIPEGYTTLRAHVVTPGLIDARSVVGLGGQLNIPHDQDQNERSAPIQPELRALDAYNPQERLVGWLRSFGVTTVHTGHAPGSVVSGQTLVVKTDGQAVDASVLVPSAMIVATLGGGASSSRSKAVAQLRTELLRAKEAAEKQSGTPDEDQSGRDLRQEALVRVIRRETPLLVHAHRAHDILTALRIAREFNICIVLDGAAEAYMVTEEIKAAGVPVIVHPTMARATGDMENLSMETAATLRKAGIPIALQSGFEGYVPKTRVVLFEAALAAANGLAFEDALAAITVDAAKLLGVEKRVGSLKAGKDADLVLFDGDPFEYTTRVTHVLLSGKPAPTEAP